MPAGARQYGVFGVQTLRILCEVLWAAYTSYTPVRRLLIDHIEFVGKVGFFALFSDL